MALEWLKPILGDTYSDELDGKISAEIGKHFVSREDFNNTNNPITTSYNSTQHYFYKKAVAILSQI